MGELDGILKVASSSIRALVEKNNELEEKIHQYEIREEAIKVAHAMHERGIDTDRTKEEIVEELVKMANDGHFDEFKEAVSMVGPDLSAFSGFKETPSAVGSMHSKLDRLLLSED